MDMNTPMGTQMPKVTKATLCSCGGMRVDVGLAPIFGTDEYELIIPTGGTA